MNTYATVVLAAGKGTRMRSILPKVLHPLTGMPLLAHVLKAIEAIPSTSSFAALPTPLTSHRPIVVVGYGAEQIEATFGTRCHYALQQEQLGTAHAVLSAMEAVNTLEPMPQTVLVCYGDTPLVSSDILARLLVEHETFHATITFLTAFADPSSDFGRVIRDTDGNVREIVEVKRASEEQKRIREVNSGVYCFDRSWLWPNLKALPRNAAGEYYLTDLIEVAFSQGKKIATVSGTLAETMGINDRVQLAAAEQLLRRRILERHMYAGVTIVDPAATYIDDDVTIGPDTLILPGTMITGKTSIGSECSIGPATTIDQSVIGNACTVRNSILEETTLEDEVSVGPFSHCRPGAYLARNVHMGNFAEVKNSSVGANTQMHHFSFLGDATVGENVNIGAGAITCNYNGREKNRTVIGAEAFIGSDTMLIAPVTIGERARTGAGSVVNKDVAPGTSVVGMPARRMRSSQPVDNPVNSVTEDGKKE
ncbi:MAG: bifunctional UDP-N-acetylglucosamine diphosphorylase/glucosamine-1-phosphate N-acetyltransferase GlmU [Chloroflexota bacterium]|nr:bifunctional UDP-N-acetylglucosamine diphosphorylase/glucosamine-1-phosphate N-acetyltransferase GlmU [Chloroflexota bacterium]